jgi:hypothetical protein
VNDFAGSVAAMAFSEQGGWLATSHDDGFVRLWSTRKEGPPVLFRAPGLQTQTLAFDTAGKYLYVGGLDQIAIFETETGAPAALANLKPMIGNRRDGVSHLAYDRESHRIASVDVNGRVTLWDASSGMQVAVLSDDERVNSPAFQANIEYSPNGKMLLTTGPNTLRIRNAETLEILKSIPTKQGFDLAFSPKSDTVAFTDLSGIVLWDIAAEGPKVVLQNNRMLRNLAYNRDGSLLAANVNNARDKSLILWDTATGASVITLNDLRDRAQTFAFSPDNTKLAAGSTDGTITFWSISP